VLQLYMQRETLAARSSSTAAKRAATHINVCADPFHGTMERLAERMLCLQGPPRAPGGAGMDIDGEPEGGPRAQRASAMVDDLFGSDEDE